MTSLGKIAAVLAEGKRFLLMTHKDPDGDGLGSMLALGKSLSDAGKEVALLAPVSYTHLTLPTILLV